MRSSVLPPEIHGSVGAWPNRVSAVVRSTPTCPPSRDGFLSWIRLGLARGREGFGQS